MRQLISLFKPTAPEATLQPSLQPESPKVLLAPANLDPFFSFHEVERARFRPGGAYYSALGILGWAPDRASTPEGFEQDHAEIRYLAAHVDCCLVAQLKEGYPCAHLHACRHLGLANRQCRVAGIDGKGMEALVKAAEAYRAASPKSREDWAAEITAWIDFNAHREVTA